MGVRVGLRVGLLVGVLVGERVGVFVGALVGVISLATNASSVVESGNVAVADGGPNTACGSSENNTKYFPVTRTLSTESTAMPKPSSP